VWLMRETQRYSGSEPHTSRSRLSGRLNLSQHPREVGEKNTWPLLVNLDIFSRYHRYASLRSLTNVRSTHRYHGPLIHTHQLRS
jgi:hypothetical protein